MLWPSSSGGVRQAVGVIVIDAGQIVQQIVAMAQRAARPGLWPWPRWS